MGLLTDKATGNKLLLHDYHIKYSWPYIIHDISHKNIRISEDPGRTFITY